MADQKENTIKLEEAMSRLDAVIAALDSDTVELEQAMKLYEEGVGLVRLCNERLTEAERTVHMLSMNADGEITEENFEING